MIPDRPLESEEYYEELKHERELKRQARKERELEDYILNGGEYEQY